VIIHTSIVPITVSALTKHGYVTEVLTVPTTLMSHLIVWHPPVAMATSNVKTRNVYQLSFVVIIMMIVATTAMSKRVAPTRVHRITGTAMALRNAFHLQVYVMEKWIVLMGKMRMTLHVQHHNVRH